MVTRVSLAAVGRLDRKVSVDASWAWIVSLDAGNRTQVLVDGANVVVRQALKIGPRHDLEKISVERRVRRKAAFGYGIRTVWMKVIKIFASPEDFEELWKGVIPFRQSSFGRRRQVAGNNGGRRWPRYRRENPPSTQVGLGIDLLRLAKEWVSTPDELRSRAGIVAIIAATKVHQVASQSHQSAILIVQVQMNWRNFKALSNPGIRIIPFPIFVSSSLPLYAGIVLIFSIPMHCTWKRRRVKHACNRGSRVFRFFRLAPRGIEQHEGKREPKNQKGDHVVSLHGLITSTFFAPAISYLSPRTRWVSYRGIFASLGIGYRFRKWSALLVEAVRADSVLPTFCQSSTKLRLVPGGIVPLDDCYRIFT